MSICVCTVLYKVEIGAVEDRELKPIVGEVCIVPLVCAGMRW